MADATQSMEYIWERLPKQKDGKTIRYRKSDLDYLYFHGFVDSRRYTLQEWKQAFAPFKQDDEGYILTKDDFISLAAYRYTGPSHEVFDPYKIQKGPWPDDKLKWLYEKSVSVASDINEKAWWALIDAFKKQGRVDKKGHLVIDEVIQAGILALIERFPSPRRRLEKEVQRIRERRGADRDAAKQYKGKSGFSVGQTAAETRSAAYQDLLSTQSKAKPGATKTSQAKEEAQENETIDIKKLRRPGGKLVG